MAITKLHSSRDFFRIWFFWKKQALFVFLLIIFAVMFYAYTATPVYKSTAKLVLLPKTDQDVVITAGQDQRQLIKSVSREDINTEMELIQSDKVLEETVKSFDNGEMELRLREKGIFDRITGVIDGIVNRILILLRLKGKPLSPFEAQVAVLKKSLEIEGIFRSNMILVTLKSQNQKSAAEVLSRLLQVYIKYHNEVFSIDEGQRFYDDQAKGYRVELEQAEKELKEFQKKLSIVDLEKQNEANIGLLTELTKELHLIEIAYDEAKGRIEILKEGLKNSDEVLVTKEMRIIPAIVELEKGIVPLRIRRTEISKTFTATSREYIQITDQIAMIENEIRNEIIKALKTDELELQSMGMKKKSLKGKISQLEATANEFKENEKILQALRRNVDIHKNNYLIYSSKTEDSRIYSERKHRNLANVSIADHPRVALRPVSPNKMFLFSISIYLGLFAALCIPFILEALDRRLKTADDVEGLLSIPVIGSFQEIT
ncbi:MAG: GumC family protein [Thermodesulfobacteriota bacterium]|nr:GumC family protein [Thermodesulfobacteriota bacterium]